MSNAILPMPPYQWQEKVWGEFVDSVVEARVPHALLMSGVEGIGADHLAVAMGQFLLCQSPMGKIACGRCKSCLLMASGNHPDLVIVTPEEKGKQIKVDDIRQLSEFVTKTSQQGAKKIIVLQPAEALNMNAANALLKNLEEPAGDTVFILVSSSLSRVLPTIRSRCAKTALPVPEAGLALSWLNSVHVAEASTLLDVAGGAPLKAKEWFDSDYLTEQNKLLKTLEALSFAQSTPIESAKAWAKSEPGSILNSMMFWVEKMIRYKLGGVTLAGLEVFEPVIEGRDVKILFRLRDSLSKKSAVLKSSPNLNPTLILEELMMDWQVIMRYQGSGSIKGG